MRNWFNALTVTATIVCIADYIAIPYANDGIGIAFCSIAALIVAAACSAMAEKIL